MTDIKTFTQLKIWDGTHVLHADAIRVRNRQIDWIGDLLRK